MVSPPISVLQQGHGDLEEHSPTGANPTAAAAAASIVTAGITSGAASDTKAEESLLFDLD